MLPNSAPTVPLAKNGVTATPTAMTTPAQQAAAISAGWIPVTSDSSSTRSSNTATGNDISRYENSFNDSSIRAASDAEARAIAAERDLLNARRMTEIAGIEKDFGDTKAATEKSQAGEYAGRSTQLITSGGGFLGATQSQEGTLQKLRETQRGELSALETKKQAAIQQARNAYDDKDFALARDLVKSAKETEQEIYKRKQDYADREIQFARYNEQDKQTAFKNSLDIVDRTAASTYDAIKGMAPAAQSVYIASMAKSLGVDPTILQGKVGEIVASKQESDRKEISTLASKYVSAGIDPAKDDLQTAIGKIRNSREYKLDIQKSEADIANISSLIADRANNGTNTFGNITPADKAAGLNYLILKKASDEDKKKFETDRGFQAWVLNKVKLSQ